MKRTVKIILFSVCYLLVVFVWMYFTGCKRGNPIEKKRYYYQFWFSEPGIVIFHGDTVTYLYNDDTIIYFLPPTNNRREFILKNQQ